MPRSSYSLVRHCCNTFGPSFAPPASVSIRKRFLSVQHVQETHKNLLRIAIVGGGATGLSAALHLAPLVDQGIIDKPIHIYECKSISECQSRSRSIGVGIWSTALKPFIQPTKVSTESQVPVVRKSHAQVIQSLEHFGTYLKDVGYRTPNGSWLVRGCLNTQPLSMRLEHETNDTPKLITDQDNPSLLFIRECDFLQTLRHAVSQEETECKTIVTHHSSKVTAVHLPSWAEYPMEDRYRPLAGQLVFDNGTLSEPYHIIIAADGMKSILRQKYAGYNSFNQQNRIEDHTMLDFSSTNKGKNMDETIATEDRMYTVFRGNSPLTKMNGSMEDGVHFQTWGEGKSMRFAAITMSYPNDSPQVSDKIHDSPRQETQVWFATTSDTTICNERDPVKQKDLLLQAFSRWHDPIERLIRSTPVENILVERGMAHKHSVNQIFHLRDILMQTSTGHSGIYEQSLGPGPILLFTGDACMTIDPVLAQGFTMGMESAADLAQTIERCFVIDRENNNDGDGITVGTLKKELMARQATRFGRMMCALRATDVVQYLAQPTKSISGMISQKVLRPISKVIPSFIKEWIFIRTIQYSLGIFQSSKR